VNADKHQDEETRRDDCGVVSSQRSGSRDADVSDVVYEAARSEFSEADLAKLTLAVAAINSWNRLNMAFRTTPGGYCQFSPYSAPSGFTIGSQAFTPE
jgi:hypothetical protein